MSKSDLHADNFSKIVLAHRDSILRFAYSYLKNKQYAEDAARKAFVAYRKSNPAFQNDAPAEKILLLQITANICEKMLSSIWKKHAVQSADNFSDLPSEDADIIKKILSLDERYRIYLHLSYYERYTIEEIAQVMDAKPAAVGARMIRAWKILDTNREEQIVKDRKAYADSMKKLRFSDSFNNKTTEAMQKSTSRRGLRITAAAIVIVLIAGILSAVLWKTSEKQKPLPPQESTPSPQITAETTELKTPDPQPAVLLLSINPEIEFCVDGEDRIISVSGTNEDGAELISGIDFTGYSFENAAITVVNKLIENNYISANEIEKTITLTLSGENKRTSLIDDMSKIIKAAASSYGINIDTNQRAEDALEIILTNQIEEPFYGETALRPADPENLPDYMQIEYKLTGKVNKPEDIGWQGEEPGRIFQAGYDEVDSVYLTIGEKKYSASDITGFDTAGGWLATSVLQITHSLIEKQYITNDIPGKVSVSLPGCTDQQYKDTQKLLSMILQEAGLHHLKVEKSSKQDSFIIVSAEEAETTPPEPARYTMKELLDVTINKNTDDITELQMEVLSMAFTYDGAVEKLKPRYWAIVPDCIGLTEDEAIRLSEQAGIPPNIVTLYLDHYDKGSPEWMNAKASVGIVSAQDPQAGQLIDVCGGLALYIVTDEPEPDIRM